MSFMGMTQLEALLLPDMDHLSMEVSFSLTHHPARVRGEADLNMFQPWSGSFSPKLQYSSDLRILDFSLRKEINDLPGE